MRQAELLMAAVILARSTSFVVSKLAVASLAPFNILAVRFLTAYQILFLLFRRRVWRADRRDVRDGVLLGLVYTGVMGCEMLGLRTAESSLASLIEDSAFILVPFLEIAFLRRYPKRAVVIGIVLAFAGLLVLHLGPGAALNAGTLFFFAGMVFYALAIFLTGVFAREGDPLLVGIFQIGTMGVVSLLVSLLFEDFRLPASGAEWGMILFIALVCSVFGFTLQPVAQRTLPADRAGMFSALNPVGAVFWGFLVLGEALTPFKLAGAALILAGLLLPLLPGRGRSSSAKNI